MESLREQLKRHEGCALELYQCPTGKNTIGYGRNLDDVGISDDEAELMFNNDLRRAYEALDRRVTHWREHPAKVQQVLLNMCFNMGIGKLVYFTRMLGHIRSGNYNKAADELLDSRYATQVGARATELAGMLRNG